MKNVPLKKIAWALFLPLIPIASLSLESCGGAPKETSVFTTDEIPTFTVYLRGDAKWITIEGENPVKVQRGGDAVFTITLNDGYALEGVYRENEKIKYDSKPLSLDRVQITVSDIRFSQYIDVNCIPAPTRIVYYPNGGEYIDGGNASDPYSVSHSLTNRLRPNTELGTNRLKRDGYLLRGWNTAADGSGLDVGLGSRVTVKEHMKLPLYAKWEKESDLSDFTFTVSEEGVAITGYSGGEKAVIPAYIQEKPVISIEASAFAGNEKQVFFPLTLETVKNGAFNNSAVEEVWFYDNLKTISDKSFVGCENLHHAHINAILPPCFGGKNLYSEINFADKYDLLILNADKKKAVVFGGSSAYISINTNIIENSLDDTMVLNMAVNGWFNGFAQVDMMMPYLKSGDMFLHFPEPSSMFGLFLGTTMIPSVGTFVYNKVRMYWCCESNYDLLGLVDLQHVTEFFDGFKVFNDYRATLTPTTYEDYRTKVNLYGTAYYNDLGYIDNRGNWTIGRPAGAGLKDSGEADAVVEFLTDPIGRARAQAEMEYIEAKGVKVFVGTAATNRDNLQLRLDQPELFTGANEGKYLYYARPDGYPDPDYPNVDVWVEEFAAEMAVTFGDRMLMKLADTLFVTTDYFEPDYHLCDEAVPVFTNRIVDALKARLTGGDR